MLTIAFWNIAKKHSSFEHIAHLAMKLESPARNDVLFCIGEPGKINMAALPSKIQSLGGGAWQFNKSINGKFAFLFNFSSINPGLERARSCPITITRVVQGKPFVFHAWFVHLKAPIGTFKPRNVASQDAVLLRKAIDDLETTTSYMNTLVIGDFNMEPYSSAMVGPTYLNAVMCRKLAKRAPRVFDKGTPDQVVCRYFYNPTWQLLGDRTATNQPGTFYIGNDPGDSTHWHLIDQVLLRYELANLIEPDSLRIPTDSGKSSLLTTHGTIDKKISDHLPIAISLNI